MIAQLSGPQMNSALSLNSIAFQGAGFWSPPISALIVAAAGPGYAFAMNTIGCLITALLLSRVPTKKPTVTSVAQVSLRRGLSTIKESTEIGWTMALAACLALLALNMPLIYADMANSVFKVGVDGYSRFNSLAAAGCVVGSLIAGRRVAKSRLRELTILLAMVSVLFLVASQAPNQWVFAGLIVILSGVSVLFQLLANALVQLSVASDVRGRVMGLYILIMFGGMSLSGPIVGTVIDHIGGRQTLIILGGLLLMVTVVTAAAIGRFAGQKITVRKGLQIVEPEVPRYVRVALRDAETVRRSADATVERILPEHLRTRDVHDRPDSDHHRMRRRDRNK